MTEPTPTPEQQHSPATPDPEESGKNNSPTPERDGFFKRVRRGLSEPLEPVRPSEAEEIVVMDD